MSPEEKRIAIAEACGWKFTKIKGEFRYVAIDPKGSVYHADFGNVSFLPDYLNDLNAMHEAELTLSDEQYSSDAFAAYEDVSFVGWLFRIMVRRVETPNFRTHSATAAQRAEAFLLTIGKIKP